MPPARPTAIVTGASSGIGRATAILLAERGYDVALVGRSESRLKETADLVREATDDAAQTAIMPTDLTRPLAAAGLIEGVVQQLGRIDALANVAGYAPLMPIPEYTPVIIQQCMDANITYVMNLTTSVWPTFEQQRSGVIVNVSSIASVDPFPGFSVYAAAKVAVNMYTKCAAEEGKKIGVKVVAIAPGAVETPMLRQIFNEKMLPQEKTLDPYEVAEAIADCITGKRNYTPGETIMMPSP